MVKIKILGNEYPLVLTVAALDDLKARGVALSEVGGLLALREGTTIETVVDNSLWLLGVLMREGKANAAYTSPEMAVGELPTAEELRHILTPGQVLYDILPQLSRALMESMARTTEAAHEKNAADAVGACP